MTPSPSDQTSYHQRGPTLDQMWIDGKEGQLLPFEHQLLAACAEGLPCEAKTIIWHEERPQYPKRSTDEIRIRGEFLRYLMLGGCAKVHIHTRGIQLTGAFIQCEKNMDGIWKVDLQGASLPNPVFLFGCYLEGSLNLAGASVPSLGLDACRIKGLVGDGLEVKRSLNLRKGFHCEGDVRLIGSKIEGQLDCHDGRFEGRLTCQEASIGNGVYLNSTDKSDDKVFSCEGVVIFANATIGGDVDAKGGCFKCKDQAFFANRATIHGDLGFEAAEFVGTISLTGCKIGGALSFTGCSMQGKPSLHLRGSTITNTLFWRDIQQITGEVDFSGSACQVLSFDRASWFDGGKASAENTGSDPSNDVSATHDDTTPQTSGHSGSQTKSNSKRHIKLDNFSYQGFSNLPDGANAQFWIDWLKVQPDDHLTRKYRPKPWSQLAGVLDSMGYEGEAKAVKIEREHMLTRFMARHDPEDSRSRLLSLNWLRVQWRRLWGVTIDYGYQPMKVIYLLILLILLTTGINGWAAYQGIMAPTHPLIFKEAMTDDEGNPIGFINPVCAENWVYFKAEECNHQVPSEYSAFSALMYSADVVIPVINFRQEDDWSPRVVDHKGNFIWSGNLVRLWEWIAIVLGWVFSLMFVSAVSGAIRR